MANRFKLIMYPKRVMSSVDRASRSVLNKFGAFVRRTSRKSIKPASRVKLNELPEDERKSVRARKKAGEKVLLPFKSSKPGEPPRSITKRLKSLISFGYQQSTQSVVVGAEKTSTKGTDVLRILEEGGTSSNTGRRNKGNRARVQARPYMGPALRENLPQLPQMWRDAIK